MKSLLMVMMIAGLMSTVGVYAASFSGGTTTKALGGSSSETVGAPTSASVDINWTFTNDTVTGAVVDWTPSAAGTYTVKLLAGTTNGEATGIVIAIGDVGVVQNQVIVLASTEASDIGTAKVVIYAE